MNFQNFLVESEFISKPNIRYEFIPQFRSSQNFSRVKNNEEIKIYLKSEKDSEERERERE
jgi:hypothetical protein